MVSDGSTTASPTREVTQIPVRHDVQLTAAPAWDYREAGSGAVPCLRWTVLAKLLAGLT